MEMTKQCEIFLDPNTAIKPAIQIQKVHPVAHSSACNPFFLPVSSRQSFTFRTPDKDQKTEELFYFLLVQILYPETFMCSMAIASLHATRKHSQKVPHAKVVRFGSLGQTPMIQVPFNSSHVALQYKTGMKYFH